MDRYRFVCSYCKCYIAVHNGIISREHTGTCPFLSSNIIPLSRNVYRGPLQALSINIRQTIDSTTIDISDLGQLGAILDLFQPQDAEEEGDFSLQGPVNVANHPDLSSYDGNIGCYVIAERIDVQNTVINNQTAQPVDEIPPLEVQRIPNIPPGQNLPPSGVLQRAQNNNVQPSMLLPPTIPADRKTTTEQLQGLNNIEPTGSRDLNQSADSARPNSNP